MPARTTRLPSLLQWTPRGRVLVFILAAASIWCLLAEMYGLCNMRTFFYAILLPATIALYTIALLDRSKGDGRLFRAVMIGTLAGLIGALAYDAFRLPFVFSDAWGMGKLGIPQMPLFKVFPRFGALILGEPLEQGVPAPQPGSAWGAGYSLAAHLLGWAYHFSNGATFGVMFAAAYTRATGLPARDFRATGLPARVLRPQEPPSLPTAPATTATLRTILWATLMAVGIEICLLLSPYSAFFGIKTTPLFIAVTLSAHIIFGIGLGLYYAWHARHWRLAP